MSNKFSSKKQLITFRELGEWGRLGNQMFQYASTRGIAANRNLNCTFPPPNDNIILYKCFRNTLKYSTHLPNYDRISPIGFEFDKSLFNQCFGNRDILHYLQTEKYFNHIKDDIKKDFTFDDFIFNSCKTYIRELYNQKEIISLHIRRTDYLTDPTMCSLSMNYYEEALNLLNSTLPVLVISDDPEWCENQEIFSSERFRIIKSKNTFVDLCLMTLCDYHIIANSSFSWWGAWLSNTKKVIAPQKWFQKNDWNTKDLYCSDWIVI